MSDNPRPSPDEGQQRAQFRSSQERYRLIVKLGRVVNANLDLRQVFRAERVAVLKTSGGRITEKR